MHIQYFDVSIPGILSSEEKDSLPGIGEYINFEPYEYYICDVIQRSELDTIVYLIPKRLEKPLKKVPEIQKFIRKLELSGRTVLRLINFDKEDIKDCDLITIE